jgi:hypothetical protein
MWIRWIVTAFMILAAVAAHADEKYCRLSCLKDSCTLNGKALDRTLMEGKANCAGLRGMAGGSGIGVWQFEKGELVLRVVNAQSDIGPMLDRADSVSGGLLAFLTRPRSQRGAGTPFGGDRDDGSASSGAAIGLPFGLVLPPHRPALLMPAAAADGDGQLTIFDATSNGQVARVNVRGGKVPFDTLTLAENKVYRYTFTSASNRRFDGKFAVASRQTARNVDEDTAYGMRKAGIPAGQAGTARARFLLEYDLRWDALQLLAKGK